MFHLNRMINTFIKLKSDIDYTKREVLNLIMVFFFWFWPGPLKDQAKDFMFFGLKA